MKSVRLLPVVIYAALALLLFKGIGLVTNGGYVLSGASTAQAAGASGGGGGDGSEGGDATMALPVEPTLSDSNPTLDDGAPTLPLRATSDGQGDAAPNSAHESGKAAESGHGDTAAPAEDAACPTKDEAAPGELFDFTRSANDCPVDPGVNAAGDSLPLIQDGGGNIVPMADAASGAEEAVMERLGARRAQLDAREAELEMRLALVEAAEQRIKERTAALEALEARISALVDEKKAMDEGQFASIVAMYETMKPKEAAAIFDQLEMPVLLRVVRAMSPRKMAPIMARMDPQKAKTLTSGMAAEQAEATFELDRENLDALPQIVGY